MKVESVATLGDDEIARRLLIELLAYQFASPVRWIETQDVLLKGGKPVERIIEVGPTPILGGLAKRTINSKYRDYFNAKGTEPQVLSTAKDFAQICYEYDEQEPVDESSPLAPATASTTSTIPPTPVTAVTSVPPPAVIVPAPAASSLPPLEDVPLPAVLVLHVLVAQKLQQPLAAVALGKSVKELTGGKSTLQNEIIGDLGVEFGDMPDGAESLSLESLGDSLKASFKGTATGKVSTQLLSRLLSSRMPGGFGSSAVREYLKTKWRLESLRQSAALLVALANAPAGRLADVATAQAFLDEVVKVYGTYVGVDLVPLAPGQAGAAGGAGGAAVDPEALKKLKVEQDSLFRKQYDLLAKHLGLNASAANEAYEAIVESLAAREGESALVNAELGEAYLSGIAPTFDAKKERVYDSDWNWARQDLYRLLNELQADPSVLLTGADVRQRLTHILNCAEPSLIDMLNFKSESLDSSQEKELKQTKAQLQQRIEFGPRYRYDCISKKPVMTVDNKGSLNYAEVLRDSGDQEGFLYTDFVTKIQREYLRASIAPCLKSRMPLKANELTQTFHHSIRQIGGTGLSFAGLVVLVTGAGPGSIGFEIVRGVLEGGGTVIATSSRSPTESSKLFQPLYTSFGGRGSKLHVLQFNQGSSQDCKALVDHIYNKLGLDLDAFIPFAAISEAGRKFDSIDGKSELAHRLMLTNIIRLVGHIKLQKESKMIRNKQTQIIVPLSPNHGIFGGDGLYGESKIGLETLYNRWYSESMSSYISICGAEIGWTRATGLMKDNDSAACAIEGNGVLTFSQKEMACNLLALMSEEMRDACTLAPVHADLSGGLHTVADLNATLADARRELRKLSKTQSLLVKDRALDDEVEGTVTVANRRSSPAKLANIQFDYPSLPRFDQDILPLHKPLRGLHDLSRVTVVVGFSELGPWGNARTRWQMETQSSFTLEGWVEIAWIMGLIKFSSGKGPADRYVGWVDSKSGAKIADGEIEKTYSQQILEHTGVRFIEPELFDGYDPHHKEFLQEIVLEEDMPPMEASKESAVAFKDRHGDKAEIIESEAGCTVILKKGATLLVPKSTPFSRLVAGQLPTGWNPKTYGIPEDIAKAVDPVALYVLCAVSEAFLSAGITDPWELWQHIHVSEFANCIGSGAGGSKALRRMYRDRYVQKQVQSDILQETFINTTAAWVNMLLLGASGPIKTPVGACASSLESLDAGVDTLLRGTAKFALVGGADDFNEELSQEFANMGATVDATKDLEAGRTPQQMSRPTSSTRAGFMQAHGAGVQLITTAEMALKMGLPIYTVIAHSSMASDKISRSVPAPGKGVLINAREASAATPSPLLDIGYRRAQKEAAEARILATAGDSTLVERQLRDVRFLWGTDFARDEPSISPLRAALAAWNLTIDDVDVVSLHGTSTKANDLNEPEVIAAQFAKLGRSKGNPALAVCQKSLTGHSLGAAGAWMLNGAVQIQTTSIVPGNANADNVDKDLAKFDALVFPNKAIRRSTIVKAVSITSFGFGQKGAQAICVHPHYLYAALSGKEEYEGYAKRAGARRRKAFTHWHRALMENSVFRAKPEPQYAAADVAGVLMDADARLAAGSVKIVPNKKVSLVATVAKASLSEDVVLANIMASLSGEDAAKATFGVDMESVPGFERSVQNPVFVERNFTAAEQSYAKAAPSPLATFCGRWVAKEAVFKSLRHRGMGAGAALKDIEILSGDGGAPVVTFHGVAKKITQELGIKEVRVSISHTDERAVAVAAAIRA